MRTWRRIRQREIGFRWGVLGLALLAGCVSPDRLASALRDGLLIDITADEPFALRDQRSFVFYLDGAGGGSPIINWGEEIHRGLDQGGCNADFVEFRWQTGFGVIADASASIEYKRERGRLLALQLRTTQALYPRAKIHVIAASAGTAVAAYALEELALDRPVDSVIFLSSALASSFELTEALRRVRGPLYVFVSEKDALLRALMPLLGSADRQQVGERIAGLEGFDVPQDEAAAAEYAKVREIPWRPEWAELGHYGGHTDCKSAAFIAAVIAPLLDSESDAPSQLVARAKIARR